MLGNVVTPDSPKGELNKRNLINIVFSGLVLALITFLGHFAVGIETLDFGKYGWAVPFVGMAIKTAIDLLTNYQNK